VGAPKTKIIL